MQDLGIANPLDMGSAMAPAAAHTIQQHFEDLKRSAADYDLIVTGDLSAIGTPIAKQLLLEEGYDIGHIYNDCGLMIYDPGQEEVFAGGSGCACSAVVTYGHLLSEMQKEFTTNFCRCYWCVIKPDDDAAKETIQQLHMVSYLRE